MSTKVGRNDPCPCGSGRKYKKCCLEHDEAARALERAAASDADDGWEDDDFEDEFDDEDELYVRAVPFDVAALTAVRYERGFFENERRLMRGGGLTATEWHAPGIPREIIESLAAESLVDLEGRWGDLRAGTPVQVDIIELQSDDDAVVVEVYNRATTLFATNDDSVKRIHRVCGVLQKAADRGTGVTALPAPASDDDFDIEEVSRAHLDAPGTCLLCGGEVMHDETLAHLASCAPEHEPATGPLGVIFMLRVTSPELRGYWLDVEMLQDAPLSTLDRLLRDTWLECCGHLSMFASGRAEYHSHKMDLDERGLGRVPRRTMTARVKDAVDDEGVLTYEYDFGSTTELSVVVLGHRSGRLGRARARLVARNAAPVWPCGVCGKPATMICYVCRHDGPNPFACAAHARRHVCREPESFMPVVNSPRLGVCGYAVDA
jgi:hypothetical protein